MNCFSTSIKPARDEEQSSDPYRVKGKRNRVVVAVVRVGIERSSAADVMKERIRQGGDIGNFTEHPREEVGGQGTAGDGSHFFGWHISSLE